MRKSCVHSVSCVCTNRPAGVGTKSVVCTMARFCTSIPLLVPSYVHSILIAINRVAILFIPTVHTPYISQKQIKFNILTMRLSGELS